jgi:hypothetical protein
LVKIKDRILPKKKKVQREFATNKAVKKAICFAKDASK